MKIAEVHLSLRELQEALVAYVNGKNLDPDMICVTGFKGKVLLQVPTHDSATLRGESFIQQSPSQCEAGEGA